MRSCANGLLILSLLSAFLPLPALADEVKAPLFRSAKSGAWSASATWEGGKLPAAGASVQIREGHTVVYDHHSDQPLRALHIAGTLTFAPDRDTRLEVGLIRVQAGDSVSEEGFDCDAHVPNPVPGKPRAALLVGTPERPIDAKHSALIRLHYFAGMDRDSCPAIVCCGGRMDFHGAPLSRTWVQFGAPVKAGDTEITLAEPVTGWRVGDRVIVTATTRQNKVKKTFRPSVRDASQTEERLVKSIAGAKLVLDSPLKFDHLCQGEYRAQVANLSRNVTVESADPTPLTTPTTARGEGSKARGHTMYHRHSAGAISYAEFRHLGMPGVLGRYSLHYHLVGDTMRGSSVVGASIWDSGNRWVTIHGTNFLVVRDCVGYQSLGHGFFLEDSTEVYNILDHNLAVQAYVTKPLPKQVLPFDSNDGSGFWWANCRNSFTRNVAAECDEYGYFFQAVDSRDFSASQTILQPDGTRKKTDIRTLPFIRFEDNEAHCQRRHAFNLGGGVPFGDAVKGVGPDERHPFVIRNFRSWNVHWAIHPVSPSLLIDGLNVFNAEYGVWRPIYRQHSYRNIKMDEVPRGLRYAFVSGKLIPNDAADYPKPLNPVDDLPPVTVMTHVLRSAGQVTVRGVTADNGKVARVLVNGQAARAVRPNFSEWEAVLPGAGTGALTLSAHAEDEAGNVEIMRHQQ